MELDLLTFEETAKDGYRMEIEMRPKKDEYRGTLMSTIFLPKYTETLNLSKKKDTFEEEFCKDQLVLLLYKSSKNNRNSSYSGDSF